MGLDTKPVCIGVVLSAGGLRGAAHLGVLRRIVRHQIPVEAMVGVSAGAVVAAYYAAVGLSIDEMIAQAPVFRGRHLVMHGVTARVHASLKPYLRRFCGIIPERLQQLDAASFAILHHGIRRLGIVCHDIDRRRPRYFSTGDCAGVCLADVARASAAVPFVLPVKTVVIGKDRVRLTDGGISDSLPVDFIRSPQMGATHVIASDCRASAPAPPSGPDWLAYIRPDLDGIRPLHAPRAALMKAVCRGEAAVTDDVVDQIQSWMRVPATS
jgi:predicted acylesterase/phospholipase RssA